MSVLHKTQDLKTTSK